MGSGSLEEGMLFVVLLKDSSLYCKIRRWVAFKKKKVKALFGANCSC